MPAPAISFVMPVYNGARYLREALASLRWQTFTNWEAVCVNDGSTDESLAILRRFATADSRFRIIDQPNEGIVGALNAGVMAARTNWIARIDADDVAVPERLAVQWQFLQQHPEVIVVGSDLLVTDPDGLPICRERYVTDHASIERNLLSGEAGGFGHPSVVFRRDKALAAGLYRKEFEWVEDIDLWLRMIALGRGANIPMPLVLYRQHEQSVCWKRREVQHQRLHGLLAQVRAERGLDPAAHAVAALKPARKRTSAAGKWARRAARAGYYHTAWKQLRRQVSAEPFSLLTLRVAVETALRAAGSLYKEREARIEQLPDWRNWDVVSTPKRRAA